MRLLIVGKSEIVLCAAVGRRRAHFAAGFCFYLQYTLSQLTHITSMFNTNMRFTRRHTHSLIHSNGAFGFSVDFGPIFEHIINANIPFIQSRFWFFRFLFLHNTPTPLLLCGARLWKERRRESDGERWQIAPAETREGWIAMRWVAVRRFICINITTPLPTSTSTTEQSQLEPESAPSESSQQKKAIKYNKMEKHIFFFADLIFMMFLLEGCSLFGVRYREPESEIFLLTFSKRWSIWLRQRRRLPLSVP